MNTRQQISRGVAASAARAGKPAAPNASRKNCGVIQIGLRENLDEVHKSAVG